MSKALIASLVVVVSAVVLWSCGALQGSAPHGSHEEPEDVPVGNWRMPDEGDPHIRTWMAFGASEDVWGNDLLPRVQEDLAAIANAIAKYEPVTMLVRPEDRARAEELCDDAVELVEADLDDLWIRDTGPCFVVGADGTLGAVDLGFNGWGGKQTHAADARLAAFVAQRAGASVMRAGVVGEGGGIEIDGHGTAIMTESCWLNDNRNPGLSKADIEARLAKALGITKFIWLPGVRGIEITDGHIDFYARFVRPGVVVAALDHDPESSDYALTREHLRLLQSATDAQGRTLEVVTLAAPRTLRPQYKTDEFCAGYINFYVCNGAVIAPQFGDRAADADAKQKLERLFPGRTVVMLDIDGIAAGGGGIHCATQQQPRAKAAPDSRPTPDPEHIKPTKDEPEPDDEESPD